MIARFLLQPKEENGHLHHGLILSMSLKSSMYATMALREITRTDTGKASQTSLSQKHQYKKEVETENGVARYGHYIVFFTSRLRFTEKVIKKQIATYLLLVI